VATFSGAPSSPPPETGTNANCTGSVTTAFASEVTTVTDQSGKKRRSTVDGLGRGGLNGLTGQKPGDPLKTYASSFSYTAHGAVGAMQLGNTKWEHTTFNSRLQPEQIGLGTGSSSDSSILRLDYGFGPAGTNNGNVMSQRIVIGGTTPLDVTQFYTYDELNRLKQARETITNGAEQWKQDYDYDRYGNRAVNPTSTIIPKPLLTPQSLNDFVWPGGIINNRIKLSTFDYDLAGNLEGDPETGANGMVYDGENRMTSYTKAGATTTYSYDGDGRRVRKVAGTGPSAVTTVFVYNVVGQLIAEYVTDPVPPAPGGGGTSYLTTDHLGSTRVVTSAADAGGNVTIKARYDYLPFGEELPLGTGGRTLGMGHSGADSTRQKFTQKERDSESGLDYFLARYYSGSQGRFTSVDPFNPNLALRGTEFVEWINQPQRWNKFAYALNNPLRFIDENGQDPLEVIKKGAQRLLRLGKALAAKSGGTLNPIVAGAELLFQALNEVFPAIRVDTRNLQYEHEKVVASLASAFFDKSFIGVQNPNAAGIDGILHEGNIPTDGIEAVQLQNNERGGVSRVLEDALDHEQKVQKSG
jgi:RHS repeat-associated protein